MVIPTIPIPDDVGDSARSQPTAKRVDPLSVGDIVPPIRLPARDGTTVAIDADDIVGNYIVLILCPDVSSPKAASALKYFKARFNVLVSAGAKLFLICQLRQHSALGLVEALGLPFPILFDPGGMTFDLFGLSGLSSKPAGILTVIIRPNQHLMALIGNAERDQSAAAAATIRSDFENRQTQQMRRHPPVLIVPDVLSRQDCDRLITIYMLQGNVFVEPGHGSKNMTGDYKMRIPDNGRDDRIDHWVINEETSRFIASRLQARLTPEIQKVFQYRITQFERFRIGCYEGERGGNAHGHRDNTLPLVAHRRFAVSINLNSEQFEGGELRFPEYGGHLYRPETGAAIAFSSSILHEPLHVTSGRRYVLLAFLFGKR
jgi:peroxiredoxin